MSRPPRSGKPLLGLGLFLLLLAGVALPTAQGAFAPQRGVAQPALLVSGLAWAALIWLVWRRPGFLCGRLAALWIFGGAVLLRAVVGLGDPLLSDDVERYVWEGGLLAEGVSPYAWSPDDPELASYQERWSGTFARMNNRDISAAYPPLVQVVFGVVTSLSGGPAVEDGRAAVRGMRLAFAGFDLLLLALLLRRFRERPGRAIVWGWSPLVALEFAGSAHLDSLGILLLMAAVLCLEGRERFSWRGHLLLALGVLVKFLPLAALPFASRERRSLVPGIALLLGVVGLGLLPLFWLQGGLGGLTSGLTQYAARWESFSLLYRPMERGLGYFMGSAWLGLESGELARLLSVALLGLVALFGWRARMDALSGASLLIGCFLLLTPTLHPWYLTWLLPFLAFRPSRAWLLLMVLAPCLYWPLTEWQARAEWLEPDWLWPLVSLPFLSLLLLESLTGGRWFSIHADSPN